MKFPGVMMFALLGSFAVACSASEAPATTDKETETGSASNQTAGEKSGDAKPATPPPPAKSSTPPKTSTVDPKPSKPAEEGKPGDAGDDDDDDNGGTGTPGRASSGKDCCFGGEFFECPNEPACFGGVDVMACMQGCGDDPSCMSACADQLSNAPPPRGCTKKPRPENASVRCN